MRFRRWIACACLCAAARVPGAAQLTQISHTLGNVYTPAYNRDGSKVAFSSFISPGYHVYVANSDGTGQVDVSAALGGRYDRYPDWSPASNRLAYQRRLPGGDDEIMTVDANGSSPMIIGTNPGLPDGRPRWSPNGQRIAWRSQRVASGAYQLMVANADGSGLRHLTLVGGSGVRYEHRWSPNGRYLAYTAKPDAQWDLYVVEVATRAVTQLTNATVQGRHWTTSAGRP